ncbi:hypothetical protein T484DRAFT_1826512 [Baffinella frigidus]|nr:hypothetical protein T484DRAFT_1826512 [Cryptophyta sp. CCMP2293]
MAPSPEAMELDARPDGSDIQDMMFSPSLAKQLNPKPLKVVELDTRADGSEIQDIMLGITGGRSVPRVFVAGKFIGGGDDVVSKGKSGELTKLFEACGAL